MENKRRTIADIEALETAKAGFANGISLQLKARIEDGYHRSLTDDEKWFIVGEAEIAYGKFLDALGVDWRNVSSSSALHWQRNSVWRKLFRKLYCGRYISFDAHCVWRQ